MKWINLYYELCDTRQLGRPGEKHVADAISVSPQVIAIIQAFQLQLRHTGKTTNTSSVLESRLKTDISTQRPSFDQQSKGVKVLSIFFFCFCCWNFISLKYNTTWDRHRHCWSFCAHTPTVFSLFRDIDIDISNNFGSSPSLTSEQELYSLGKGKANLTGETHEVIYLDAVRDSVLIHTPTGTRGEKHEMFNILHTAYGRFVHTSECRREWCKVMTDIYWYMIQTYGHARADHECASRFRIGTEMWMRAHRF